MMPSSSMTSGERFIDLSRGVRAKEDHYLVSMYQIYGVDWCCASASVVADVSMRLHVVVAIAISLVVCACHAGWSATVAPQGSS